MVELHAPRPRKFWSKKCMNTLFSLLTSSSRMCTVQTFLQNPHLLAQHVLPGAIILIGQLRREMWDNFQLWKRTGLTPICVILTPRHCCRENCSWSCTCTGLRGSQTCFCKTHSANKTSLRSINMSDASKNNVSLSASALGNNTVEPFEKESNTSHSQDSLLGETPVVEGYLVTSYIVIGGFTLQTTATGISAFLRHCVIPCVTCKRKAGNLLKKVFFSLSGSFGVVGNFWVIIVILSSPSMRKRLINILFTSQSCLDFLCGLLLIMTRHAHTFFPEGGHFGITGKCTPVSSVWFNLWIEKHSLASHLALLDMNDFSFGQWGLVPNFQQCFGCIKPTFLRFCTLGKELSEPWSNWSCCVCILKPRECPCPLFSHRFHMHGSKNLDQVWQLHGSWREGRCPKPVELFLSLEFTRGRPSGFSSDLGLLWNMFKIFVGHAATNNNTGVHDVWIRLCFPNFQEHFNVCLRLFPACLHAQEESGSYWLTTFGQMDSCFS